MPFARARDVHDEEQRSPHGQSGRDPCSWPIVAHPAALAGHHAAMARHTIGRLPYAGESARMERSVPLTLSSSTVDAATYAAVASSQTRFRGQGRSVVVKTNGLLPGATAALQELSASVAGDGAVAFVVTATASVAVSYSMR